MTSLEIGLLVLSFLLLILSSFIIHNDQRRRDKTENLHDMLLDRIEEIEDKGKLLASDDREKQALLNVCEELEKIIDA